MARGRKRGRGRKGKSRRRNPGGVDYAQAAMIGAGLGAVGLAIATAMRVSTPPQVVDTVAPTAGTVPILLGYVQPRDTPGMAIAKAALRGAVLGGAVGVTTAIVANEMGVGAMGRMMNPTSPAAALILGTTMGTVTLASDHLLGKALTAA